VRVALGRLRQANLKFGALPRGADDADLAAMGAHDLVDQRQAQSHAVLDAYSAGGGNCIDTADGYSAWAPGNVGGESETIIGNWLAERGNRDDVVVATKVSRHRDARGLSRASIRRGLENSLRRLQTDHIDLYYAHYDDPDTPLEETVAAFGEVVAEGKVRYVAASNHRPARIQESLKIADALGVARYVAVQPHYNLVHRGDVEATRIEVPRLGQGVRAGPEEHLAIGQHQHQRAGVLHRRRHRNAGGRRSQGLEPR
jgi:aryl-alcohol dehydrogenase-like predicted oxidoreductase